MRGSRGCVITDTESPSGRYAADMPSHESAPPSWIEEAVCGYCPSRRSPPGEFDVAARPDKAWPWIKAEGRRVDAESGVGVCVHPDKVRLPVGRWGTERRFPDLSAWQVAPEPATPAAEPEPSPPVDEPVSPGLQRLLRGSRPASRRPRRDERRPPPRPAPSVPGLELPDVPDDAGLLVQWMRTVLGSADSDRFADVVAAAEHAAGEIHEPATVVAALRSAMS